MEKIGSKFIEFFVSNDIIKNEDKEIYKYALNIILSSLIHIATVMILGLCFNLLIESLVFYFAYIVIRKFAGGYHANTQLRCFLASVISTLFILGLMKWVLLFDNIIIDFLIEVLGLVCTIIIGFLSPSDTDAKPLCDKEKRLYKKVTILISFALLILSAVLFMFGINNMSYSIVLAIYMSVFVVVLGKIKEKFLLLL